MATMALNTEESKAATVDMWNALNALPGHAFGERAFEKIALTAYRKAVLAKQQRDENPMPLAAE
jgi:hypothetical protein